MFDWENLSKVSTRQKMMCKEIQQLTDINSFFSLRLLASLFSFSCLAYLLIIDRVCHFFDEYIRWTREEWVSVRCLSPESMRSFILSSLPCYHHSYHIELSFTVKKRCILLSRRGTAAAAACPLPAESSRVGTIVLHLGEVGSLASKMVVIVLALSISCFCGALSRSPMN